MSGSKNIETQTGLVHAMRSNGPLHQVIVQSEHYRELHKHSGTVPAMVYMFQVVYTTFSLYGR